MLGGTRFSDTRYSDTRYSDTIVFLGTPVRQIFYPQQGMDGGWQGQGTVINFFPLLARNPENLEAPWWLL